MPKFPVRGAGPIRGRDLATAWLPAEPTAVMQFEDFLDDLSFFEPRERDRIKLAGDEILDNLIRHSAPILGGTIAVRAGRRREELFLTFLFRSPNFAGFAARCIDSAPLFDIESRRWRGIGMLMVRNLANRLTLRPGSLTDRIFLGFTIGVEPEIRLSPSPGSARSANRPLVGK